MLAALVSVVGITRMVAVLQWRSNRYSCIGVGLLNEGTLEGALRLA